ncbi:MAG TPA: Eco57I restriction-modification methylase domain-containing protein [Melioribacteraceae bacterium]|nr:Eco57I restriction-modification methylase domain-containing protein [Melioribacteraceae bacterium]
MDLDRSSNNFSLPSDYADSIAQIITLEKDKLERQKLGQFFTPKLTAKKFVEFCNLSVTKEVISICEPACGLGILSCSLIEQLCKNNSVKQIDLTCFEIDLEIINFTKSILDSLKNYCLKFDVTLNYNLIADDFILYYKDVLQSENNYSQFDIIICNPPFFKLNNYDERVKLAKKILYGLPNIYTIFFYISTKVVNQKGYLYFLIPRSFCSDSFYKQYRKHFIDYINFNKIHLFSSEDKIFDSHCVLYEFIFLSAVKEEIFNEYPIFISHSQTVNSESDVILNYSFNLNTNTIPLPSSNKDLFILKKLNSYNQSLRSLGFINKYGKLIITKVDKYLLKEQNLNTYPVIWLHNIESTNFVFPVNNKYPNYILNTSDITQYLINNENYIFFRRYNNNDYIKRIVATVYQKGAINSDYLAIDRLVGVLHQESDDLPIETYCGLTAYLNSEIVNSYFRMINGIINVTGEMILDLPIPNTDVINYVGIEIIKNKIIDIELIFLQS